MINENQPNHSIKLAFISLVCFPCAVCVFFCITRKSVQKTAVLVFRKKSLVKKVKDKVIFTVDEDIFPFHPSIFLKVKEEVMVHEVKL